MDILKMLNKFHFYFNNMWILIIIIIECRIEIKQWLVSLYIFRFIVGSLYVFRIFEFTIVGSKNLNFSIRQACSNSQVTAQ